MEYTIQQHLYIMKLIIFRYFVGISSMKSLGIQMDWEVPITQLFGKTSQI